MFQSDDFDDIISDESFANFDDDILEQGDQLTTKVLEEKANRLISKVTKSIQCPSIKEIIGTSPARENDSGSSFRVNRYSSKQQVPGISNQTSVLEEKAKRLIAKLDGQSNRDTIEALPPARKDSVINNSVVVPRTSNETPNKIKRKRKFPGPAGLLSENFEESSSERIRNIPLSQSFPNSQNLVSNSVFNEAPWLSMLDDMKDIWDHTIVDIKQKSLENRLVGRKVPILAGVVQNVDRTLPDPLLVLRDQTGEIQCTLHRDAWECLACHLVPHYSVMVLKNSTVFITGTALKKIYLNITNNNVLAVYCDEENVFSMNPNVLKSSRIDVSKIYSEDVSTKDGSRVIVLKNRHLDKGDTRKADNNILAKTTEFQDPMSDIAHSLLDGITDEFISQEFL